MNPTYAAEYRRLWDEHWWWRSRRRFVCDLLNQLPLPSNAQALDIGCGDALFFDDLAKHGSVHGIEPDINLLDDANPHRSNITVAPFGPGYETDERYDLITMLDVLEHIEDDAGTLSKVRDMLTPDGYVLLTVPAFNWLWSQHDVANQHYRRYTRKELSHKLKQQGFTLHRCGYTFGWTVAAMLVRKLLNPGQPAPGGAGILHADGPSGVGILPAKDATDEDNYRVTAPPAPINQAMYAYTRAEQMIAKVLPLPLGSSVYAVAQRR